MTTSILLWFDILDAFMLMLKLGKTSRWSEQRSCQKVDEDAMSDCRFHHMDLDLKKNLIVQTNASKHDIGFNDLIM